MRNKPNYVGIDDDIFGGMTPIGTIIRDAWVFGLPPDLRERHQRIYEAAVQKAKALGWDPELNDEDT
jgi:hypothetical protein